jgi:hypothetical protein
MSVKNRLLDFLQHISLYYSKENKSITREKSTKASNFTCLRLIRQKQQMYAKTAFYYGETE